MRRPQDDINDPEATCIRCGQTNKLRWYQQIDIDYYSVPHPWTGEERYYGKLQEGVPICPTCHKGRYIGPRAGKPGELLVLNPLSAIGLRWCEERGFTPEKIGKLTATYLKHAEREKGMRIRLTPEENLRLSARLRKW